MFKQLKYKINVECPGSMFSFSCFVLKLYVIIIYNNIAQSVLRNGDSGVICVEKEMMRFLLAPFNIC